MSLRAKRSNLASLAHACAAEIASSRCALLAMTRGVIASEAKQSRFACAACVVEIASEAFGLLAMTRGCVIASEAKQSRFTCACVRGGDCFVTLRAPRNDAGCHCERSEAISLRLRCVRGGDCLGGLRPPRNDARVRHCERSEAISLHMRMRARRRLLRHAARSSQ